MCVREREDIFGNENIFTCFQTVRLFLESAICFGGWDTVVKTFLNSKNLQSEGNLKK